MDNFGNFNNNLFNSNGSAPQSGGYTPNNNPSNPASGPTLDDGWLGSTQGYNTAGYNGAGNLGSGQGYNAGGASNPYGSGYQGNAQGYNNGYNGGYAQNPNMGAYGAQGAYNGYNQNPGGYQGGYNQNPGYSRNPGYGGGYNPNAGYSQTPGYNQGTGAYGAQGGYSSPYQSSAFRYYEQGFGGGNRSFSSRVPAVSGKAINYCIFLPLLALFLENFAISKYLGVLLWVLVIVFLRVAAYNDAKKLVDDDKMPDSMKTLAAIAPIVYVFRRNSLFSKSVFQGALLSLTVLLALFTNGFVRSFYVTPEDFIDYAKETSVSYLKLKDNSKNTESISKRIDGFIESQDWSYSRFDGKSTVIVTGTFAKDAPDGYGGKDIKLTFEYDFDGYNVKAMSLELGDCEIAGEEIESKELKKLALGLFEEWDTGDVTVSDDDSSESEQDDEIKQA